MSIEHENTIRTGTVLRVAGGLLARTVVVLAVASGISRADVETKTAKGLAGFSIPGAIGARGRLQPGPCPDGVSSWAAQPVEIRGPASMTVAFETTGGWSPLRPAPLRTSLVVGDVYRLRLGLGEGRELFPTVRLLARLASPPGMDRRFPVEIVIDEADVDAALAGALVRRVVYAACEPDRPDILPEQWFDVRPGDDALDVAGTLGDPVAEVIIGNRLPASREPAR